MAVTWMAAQDHDSVSALFKGLKDELWIDPAATHDSNDSEVGRIGLARPSRGIGSFVRTPVTQKTDDFGFKTGHRGMALSNPVGAGLLFLRIVPHP